MVGVQIPPDAEAAGKPLESLELPPQEVLQPNSEVIAATAAPDEEALYSALTRVAVG